MRVRYFLIAGGNETALVWGAEPADKAKIAQQLLSRVEQVGFIEEKPERSLEMMGGELCVNALLATAFASGGQGKILSVATQVRFSPLGGNISVILPLDYRVIRDKIVVFDSIGYLLTAESITAKKEDLIEYCDKYGLPAFGVIRLKGNTITPTVYVCKTDSLTRETACGSGSIAAFLICGRSKIIQPTGRTINISRQGKNFTIDGEVSEVYG